MKPSPLHQRHLKPNHFLVASSSLICLPAMLLILSAPHPTQQTHFFGHLCFLIVMSALSICRWADPNPIFRKLDSTFAKSFFMYYSTMTIATKPKKILTLCCVSMIALCYQLSRFFRNNYPFKYWYVFHMVYHIMGIYCVTTLFYELQLMPPTNECDTTTSLFFSLNKRYKYDKQRTNQEATDS